MKLFPYNDKMFVESEHGSFTIVAKELYPIFKGMGVIGEINDPNTVVIQPECLDTSRKSNRFVPYLACEYSRPTVFSKHHLNLYSPFILTISEFARQNILRGMNYDPNKIKSVHLGANSAKWYKMPNVEKFPVFTYLTVNTSNDRSGYEYLIPAFNRFSQGKEVNLIIKDGDRNEKLESYISSLNNPKIIYTHGKLSTEELRVLYNKAHVFLYANNTTSFGMNIMDAALCGTPVLATMGSAIKEFLPDWTQPVKILTKIHNFENHIFEKMLNAGINPASIPNKAYYDGEVTGEIVVEDSILDSLNYSVDNYQSLLDINKKHIQFILENFTWEKTCNRILKLVTEYYK